MIVRVEQEDITLGMRRNCYECPIALAIWRAGFFRVRVATGVIEYGPFWQPTTPEVEKFIRDFDNGKLVHPFEFELKYGLDGSFSD